MKTVIAMIGASALVLGAGFAAAKDGARGEKMFQRVDADGDGRITRAESEAFRDARFTRMDLNGDGAVSLEEMTEASRKRHAERMAKRFERLDSNGNGVVERAEFEGRRATMFDKLDTNGDGAVTLEEMRARKGRLKGG